MTDQSIAFISKFPQKIIAFCCSHSYPQGWRKVTVLLSVTVDFARKAATQSAYESSHVLSPELLRFVWIWLEFLLFRILYITGATKGYLFDLTLGVSHSSRSLRSTYLGCSFNFCLLHLTAIFGDSFAKICCILVAGLKPAPRMFSQCCASCQIVLILIC